MLPGPTIIRKCKACRKLIAQNTISSGNTFGACIWSDGNRDAPMLPGQPWLVKCPYCSALLWMDEQEQIGEIEYWQAHDQNFHADWKAALHYAMLSWQDYQMLLSTGNFNAKKERYIRIRSWWAGNDHRRYPNNEDLNQNSGFGEPMSFDEVCNIRALMAMLDETKEIDRLMKAEAMRELGMFKEAKALLSYDYSEEYRETVSALRDLVAKEIAVVRPLFGGGFRFAYNKRL